MSTVKANNVQVGQSGTATNNFTLYQPSTPDGTVRLAVGNSGATTADVLTANSSGNVGIGTSSPNANGKLTVAGNIVFPSAGNSLVDDAGNNIIQRTAGGYVTIGSTAWNQIRFGTAGGAQAMTLDASGNLGVGTTSPGTFNQRVSAPHLVVGGGTNAAGLTLYSGTTNQSSINFAIGTTTTQQYDGGFVYVPNGGSPYLTFHVNGGAERARITSGGDLLVGTTANTGATLAVCAAAEIFKLTKTFNQTFTTNPQTRNISLTVNDSVGLSVEITITGNYSTNNYSGAMKQAYGFLTNQSSTNLFGSANTSMYSLGNTSSAYAFGAATKPNNTTVNIPITYTGADTNTNLYVVVEIYGKAGGITAISFS